MLKNRKGFLPSEILIMFMILLTGIILIVPYISKELEWMGEGSKVAAIAIGLGIFIAVVYAILSKEYRSYDEEECSDQIISEDHIDIQVTDKTEGTHFGVMPLGKVIMPKFETDYYIEYMYKGTKFEIDVDSELYDTIQIGDTLKAIKTEYKSSFGTLEIEIEICV